MGEQKFEGGTADSWNQLTSGAMRTAMRYAPVLPVAVQRQAHQVPSVVPYRAPNRMLVKMLPGMEKHCFQRKRRVKTTKRCSSAAKDEARYVVRVLVSCGRSETE